MASHEFTPHIPSPEEVAKTVRLERLRAIATGVFESAPSTFLLLILVRAFNGTNAEKSMIAAAYQSGLILTPLTLFLTRRFSWAPSQSMALLFWRGDMRGEFMGSHGS